MTIDVSSINFGKKIGGQYNKVQKISHEAGYPGKYIAKINERLHSLFPNKSDTVEFIYRNKEVFNGCCGCDYIPVREVYVYRNNLFLASEKITTEKVGELPFYKLASRLNSEKNAAKYCAEKRLQDNRQLLAKYFIAAIKLAKKIK